jgi:hypothetical protein
LLLAPPTKATMFDYGHSPDSRRETQRQHDAGGNPGRYRAQGRLRLLARGFRVRVGEPRQDPGATPSTASSVADDAVRVGPFAAATPEVARALLSQALPAMPLDPPVEIVVPDPTDSPAREVLAEFGFRERQDRLRMELGGPFAPAGVEQYGTTPYLVT